MKNILLTLTITAIGCMAWGQKEYHVAKNGNDRANGSKLHPLLTIAAAAAKALPGDMITVHAGVYRERIDPPRGGASNAKRITYRAAVGESVVIKGSEIVKGWVQVRSNIWRLALPDGYFGAYNPYTDLIFGDWFFPGKHALHTGEVFDNGQPLYEVDSLQELINGQPARPRLGAIGIDTAALYAVWCCEHRQDTTVIYARFPERDPNRDTVEINTRPACFYPSATGVDYITIRGFEMCQAATQWAAPTAEQIGLIGTNWSKGWIIEDNIIHDSKCVGIALGKDRASGHNVWSKDLDQDGAVLYNQMVRTVIAEGWGKEKIGSHVVRHNTIYRCLEAGVCGSFGAAFSTIEDNHIYDICTYRPFWGAEMAGVKLHAGIDAVIRHNRIHNTKMGIWLDWMTQGTRITGNLLYDNDFADLYPEVDHGPYLVDNNISLSWYSLRDWSEGGAFVHNLFAGVIGHTTERRVTPFFRPHSTVLAGEMDIKGGDDRFFNNIFIGNAGKHYVMPPQIVIGWDRMDDNADYGLSMYDSAVRPVLAGGNLYINGAKPPAVEKDPLMGRLNEVQWHLVCTQDSVVLEWDVDQLKPGLLRPVLRSKQLGMAAVSTQYFTTAADLPIIFDLTYDNKRRTAGSPGPFLRAQKKKQRMVLWPLPHAYDKKGQ